MEDMSSLYIYTVLCQASWARNRRRSEPAVRALSFLVLKRLSQKGAQPNSTAFLAMRIQALTKPNRFDLYLLRQPLKDQEGKRANRRFASSAVAGPRRLTQHCKCTVMTCPPFF